MAKNEINALVGYFFKNVRKMNGLTQNDMAAILGTSQARVYGVESGKLDIPPTWVVTLFDVIKVNPMYLFGLSKEVYIQGSPKGYKLDDHIPFAYAPKKIVIPQRKESRESQLN